ncbi:uncharacterized protein [Miscanthus floridulus]|uniref:uncharacterized protein n=1 Tax=Miscanthus floridulus TaxID=154761 RepID=UPI003459CA6D
MSGLAFLGVGGDDTSGLAIACPKAEADTPEAWAFGKRTVSPMGSMVEVERADPKEPVAQGEATEVATKQAGEEAPTPHVAEACELDEAEAPPVLEATEGETEAPRTSKAEAVEARAPRTTKAEVAEAGALETTEAKVAEAEVASTVEQPALTSGEGSSALVWGALHTGVKHALAIVSSHYAGINLEAVNNGYVMAEDDENAKEEVMKLVEVDEAPSTALASLFEEEVVPPMPSTDAGDPKF